MGFPIPRIDVFLILAILILSILLGTSSILFLTQKAFADGFSERTFTASFQGRDANLFVKVNPPILTSENKQDAFMLFRLFDSQTNQTIKFTSLFISIAKDDKVLVNDLFQSAEGLIKLKIQPDETADKVTIYGNKEGFLDAWVADPEGTINLKGPVLVESGLYRIHVEVFGIDSPKKIFPDNETKKFDAFLSVGDIFHSEIYDNATGQIHNVTIISYYDKINGFDYNQANHALSWSIPFNYDVNRIRNEPDIYVHEEVRIPRSIKGLSDSLLFAGTVNGRQLVCNSLVIDPYSSDTDMIVHYQIGKKDIVKLAEEYNATNNQSDNTGSLMQFTLFGSKRCPHETSTNLITDTGGISVMLKWTPAQLEANTNENLTIQFSDAASESSLTSNVKYDFTVLDKAGNAVLRKGNLTAENAADNISFRLPAEGEYPIEITVKQLVANSSSGPIEDSTRSGRALGYVVVPEFGSIAPFIVTASIMSAIFVISRFLASNQRLNRSSELLKSHLIKVHGTSL